MQNTIRHPSDDHIVLRQSLFYYFLMFGIYLLTSDLFV